MLFDYSRSAMFVFWVLFFIIPSRRIYIEFGLEVGIRLKHIHHLVEIHKTHISFGKVNSKESGGLLLEHVSECDNNKS